MLFYFFHLLKVRKGKIKHFLNLFIFLRYLQSEKKKPLVYHNRIQCQRTNECILMEYFIKKV